MRLLASLSAALIAAGLVASPVTAQPQRIVSLDYCADQYVLGLARREQIAALSPLARSDYASLAAEADGLPLIRADLEAVLAARPDLVVRNWGGDGRLMALLERLGIAVHQIGYVTSFDDVRREVRAASEAFAEPETGEAVLARMDAALVAIEAAGPLTALYVTPGGVTAGDGTFIDAIIRAAGLDNTARQPGWADLPLEAVAAAAPDIIVTGFMNGGTEGVNAWSASRHPVMRRALEQRPAIPLDTGVLSCASWLAADEAVRLNAFARREAQP
ncbi:MAG: ABC transporter substrate-binding protein [Glycocaulis sp.]